MNRANLSPYVHTIETVNTIRFDLLAALCAFLRQLLHGLQKLSAI